MKPEEKEKGRKGEKRLERVTEKKTIGGKKQKEEEKREGLKAGRSFPITQLYQHQHLSAFSSRLNVRLNILQHSNDMAFMHFTRGHPTPPTSIQCVNFPHTMESPELNTAPHMAYIE